MTGLNFENFVGNLGAFVVDKAIFLLLCSRETKQSNVKFNYRNIRSRAIVRIHIYTEDSTYIVIYRYNTGSIVFFQILIQFRRKLFKSIYIV